MDTFPVEADGWTPPATAGGTWCRVSPEGIYEFWPRPQTSCDVVLSDGIKALLGLSAASSVEVRTAGVLDASQL
jgi:hypothetical protein